MLVFLLITDGVPAQNDLATMRHGLPFSLFYDILASQRN